MSIVSILEIAKRAEEKADKAIERSEEAINGWLGIAADVTRLHGRFEGLELLVKQALRKLGETAEKAHRAAMKSNHDLEELTREVEDSNVRHLRDELREAQRRLDSMRARDFMQRRLAMNNKWITGIGCACGAAGVALEFLAQQHVGGAIAMAVGVALAALGKSFLGSGQ